MSWTQPLCYDCWDLRHPDRLLPIEKRLYAGETETCCDCGRGTLSGIYFRVDPATVSFPREEVASRGA